MTSGPQTAQVVVADDDLLFSSRISAALATLGYRPVAVRSEAALWEAMRAAPRAAIVNLALRGFDAADAIRRLKIDAATREIPLLGFCGHRDVDRARAARAAGCDAVTTNGVVAADLRRVLDALIDSARPSAGTA